MIQVGKPVLGNNLIGRDSELQVIIELLNTGQSVVIIAPRRMGKTSLVLELLHQIKNKNQFTTYTDVFSAPDIPGLAARITEAVLANRKFDKAFRKTLKNVSEAFQNLQFRQEIEDYAFIIDFNSKAKQSPWELLENSLDMIEHYASKHNKQITTAFDEFGDIKKLDGNEIVKLFRSKIQMQQHTAYLFSGSYESVMNDLFISRNSPFFRMARIITLGNIHRSDFIPYIKTVLNKENINVSDERIDRLLDFTLGHPYYTQLYLQEIMIQTKINPQKSLPTHYQMISHLLLIEKNYLEKSWEELSQSKELRKLIIELAKEPDKIYSQLNDREINIPRGLNKLKGKGIILSDGKKHYLSDPLFKEWINRNINY